MVRVYGANGRGSTGGEVYGVGRWESNCSLNLGVVGGPRWCKNGVWGGVGLGVMGVKGRDWSEGL